MNEASLPWAAILGFIAALGGAVVAAFKYKRDRKRIELAATVIALLALVAFCIRSVSGSALEERMKPRSLARPELLAAAVSAFPCESLSIQCDTDQQPFARQIKDALYPHWPRIQIEHSEHQRMPMGMTLYVASNAPKGTNYAARSFADGLRSAGVTDLKGPVIGEPSPLALDFEAFAMTGGPCPQLPSGNNIALTVGAKK